jgi:hypothetical protein
MIWGLQKNRSSSCYTTAGPCSREVLRCFQIRNRRAQEQDYRVPTVELRTHPTHSCMTYRWRGRFHWKYEKRIEKSHEDMLDVP